MYQTASFLCWWQVRQTAEQLRFGPSWSDSAALTKTAFSCFCIYLLESTSCLCVFSLLHPNFHFESDRVKVKSRVIPTGTERLSSSLHASSGAAEVWFKSNQRGSSAAVLKAGGSGGGGSHCRQSGQVKEDESCSGMPLITNKRRESEVLKYPRAPKPLLPTTKLPSTPTQQHGRPSLRDRSHTAGDTDTDPSGTAGLRTAGAWGNRGARAGRKLDVKKKN